MSGFVSRITMRSGSQLPTIAFGTGSSYKGRANTVAEGVINAWKAGFRHFDTAQMYGTEPAVGEGLKKLFRDYGVQRQDIFITTKMLPHCHTQDEAIKLFENSLSVLNVDYLDLMMHHCPSTVLEKDITKRWLQSRNLLDQEWEGVPKTPKAAQKGRMAVWAVLQKMKEEGKVRHLGVSNYTRRHLRLLAEDNQCSELPEVNQIEMHPYLFDECNVKANKELGILVQAYSPMGSGSLDERPELAEKKFLLEEPILHEIAKRQNCSSGQVCLAWVMSKNAALVTKTKSPDRMKENLEATKVHLDKEDLILIDQMTRTNQRLFLDPYKFY